MAFKLYEGDSYASDEEVYFSWWLDELVRHGYIKSYDYEVEEFKLFGGLRLGYMKQLKTKVRENDFQVLPKQVYTPDFRINWTPKADRIFCTDIVASVPKENRGYFVSQEMRTRVEIKPNFDSRNMTRHVKSLINWTWAVWDIFVQLTIPVPKVGKKGNVSPAGTLFADTFVPERYLMTDSGKQARKIKFNYKTLHEYVAEREKRWEEIEKSAS